MWQLFEMHLMFTKQLVWPWLCVRTGDVQRWKAENVYLPGFIHGWTETQNGRVLARRGRANQPAELPLKATLRVSRCFRTVFKITNRFLGPWTVEPQTAVSGLLHSYSLRIWKKMQWVYSKFPPSRPWCSVLGSAFIRELGVCSVPPWWHSSREDGDRDKRDLDKL